MPGNWASTSGSAEITHFGDGVVEGSVEFEAVNEQDGSTKSVSGTFRATGG